MTIEELIFQNSNKYSNKTAVICGDISVSYKALWKEILIKKTYFESLNLEKGSRIVLSASKNIDFIYSYFGAHLAGLICMPIDSETNELRLKRIISIAEPKYYFGELRNSNNINVISFSEMKSDSVIKTEVEFPDENEIADLLFTTGTTGTPKGVALSFKNEYAAADNINTFIQNSVDDIELLALPISHSFGLGRLRCVLSKGATLVILGSFASMKKFYGEIERCKVTGFGMVPASWAFISKMSGDKIQQFANQIKYIEIGSSFMPIKEKQRLMSLLPNTRICMHYGLTEASRSAFIEFNESKDFLDSVGKASPNTEIAVFDENGIRITDSSEGEICIKGNHVCSDYWGWKKEEFEKEFYDGFFKTGDWGYINDNGYIYLKSRKKEIINVGGKKVSPIEVEEALNSLDGINESACIAVHDDVMGEVVKAFVVGSTTPQDDEDIKKKLTKLLENYKVPVYIEHINEIPKTQNGKIQRLLLK